MAPVNEKELTNALFELEDEVFMVDNSRLNSTSKGIRFRSSPSMDDVDKRVGNLAKFGNMVEGISWPEGWLLVDGFGKRRFLPKKIDGVPILVPITNGEGTRDSYDDPGDEWPIFAQRETPQRPPRSQPARQPMARQERAAGQLTNDEEDLLEVCDDMVHSTQELIEGLVALRWKVEKLKQRAGGGIDVRSPEGYTPLMMAARRGNIDYCVVLIRAGADATLRSPEGLVARELAGWKPCGALIAALAGDDYHTQDLRAALGKLQPDLKKTAEENIRVLSDRDPRKGSQADEALRPAAQGELQSAKKKMTRGGVPFRVVCEQVTVHEQPLHGSHEITELLKDDVIEVFSYDYTRSWARISIQLPHGSESGWVQIQSDELGELIKPVR